MMDSELLLDDTMAMFLLTLWRLSLTNYEDDLDIIEEVMEFEERMGL